MSYRHYKMQPFVFSRLLLLQCPVIHIIKIACSSWSPNLVAIGKSFPLFPNLTYLSITRTYSSYCLSSNTQVGLKTCQVHACMHKIMTSWRAREKGLWSDETLSRVLLSFSLYICLTCAIIYKISFEEKNAKRWFKYSPRLFMILILNCLPCPFLHSTHWIL